MKLFARTLAISCLAALSCGGPGLPRPASGGAAATSRDEEAAPDQPRFGPTPSEYGTAPAPGGASGGPDAAALEREITSALGERGDVAVADGALAATARWFLNEVAEGRAPDSTACERAGRRFGFVGTVMLAVAYDLEHPEVHSWRESLGALPRNLPVTRFGVRAAPGGRLMAVVFGAVEATMRPFPRRLDVGGALRLQGEVAPRFSAARIYVTHPDGTVTRASSGSRAFDESLTLTAPGIYQVEVMGDGATGPVIVVNVPLYVGVAEPDAARAKGLAVTDPPAVEARMLALLNEARGHIGLAPVAADEELRRLALAHGEDMTRNHFFGHVSPTTGTLDDRVRRAGLRVALAGENVVQAKDADAGHEHLMGSPAHRANMVNPRFTHVGIAALADAPSGNVLVTLVFARRAPVIATVPTSAEVQQRVQAARRSKSLGAVEIEPSLQGAAEAGIKALAGGATADGALEAAGAELRRRPRRHPIAGEKICSQLAELFELDDLQERSFIASPALRQLGVAVAVIGAPGAQKVWLLSMYAGPRCHE